MPCLKKRYDVCDITLLDIKNVVKVGAPVDHAVPVMESLLTTISSVSNLLNLIMR